MVGGVSYSHVDDDGLHVTDKKGEVRRVAGQRVAGQRVAGQRVAGQRAAGQRVAGQRVAGQRVACGRLLCGPSVIHFTGATRGGMRCMAAWMPY